MNCRIIGLKGNNYLEIEDTGAKYKVTLKKYKGKDRAYTYYLVKLPIGRDPLTHAIIQHDVTGHTLSKLVDNVLALAELSDDEMRLTNTDLSIRTISADWFELHSISWSNISKNRYRCILSNLLDDPIVDQTPISLTEADIIEWQKRILSKYPLASVSHLWICLHMIIKYAIDHRYAFFDPMPYAMIFKYTPENGIALTRYQIWSLLYRNYNNKFFILLAITLLTAMRIREALGLSWNDIDFEHKCIHIHQQCQRNPETGKLEIVPFTKTRRPRTVYPPECFFWCLNKQKRCQEIWARNETYDNKYNLVITNPDGSPVSYASASAALDRALYGTEPDGISLHDLRTTCATYGARLSGDLTATQFYLGHKTKRTLFDYIYSDAEDQSEMIEAIDQYYAESFICRN